MSAADNLAGCALDEEQLVTDAAQVALVVDFNEITPVIGRIVEREPDRPQAPFGIREQVEGSRQDTGQDFSCFGGAGL